MVKLGGRQTEQTLNVSLESLPLTPNVLIQPASDGTDGDGVDERDYSIVQSELLWGPEDRSLDVLIRISADMRVEESEGFQLRAYITQINKVASTFVVLEDNDGECMQSA